MKKNARNLISVLAAVAIVGGVGCGLYFGNAQVKSWVDGAFKVSSSSVPGSSSVPSSSAGSSSDESKPSVQVRLLSTGTDADGHETRTFGYSITPENATEQNISVSLAWTNTGIADALSDFLAASVNSAEKTITVTMKKRFSNQATLTVSSVDNPSLSAKVTIDVMRHMTGVSTNDSYSSHGLDFVKKLNDDSTGYVHYGCDGDGPYFKTASGTTPISAAIDRVYDEVYSEVPASSGLPQMAVEPVLVSSGISFRYSVSSGVDYVWSSLASGPIAESDLSFANLYLGRLIAGGIKSLTCAEAVSEINAKIGALSDNKRSYLNGIVNPSGATSKGICISSVWDITCLYGEDKLVQRVSCGIEVPFESISFKVPVTGLSSSETGIHF